MKNLIQTFTLAVLALLALPLRAQDPGPLPPYQPPPNRTPVVRLWGNRFMSALARHWAEGFHAALKDALAVKGPRLIEALL